MLLATHPDVFVPTRRKELNFFDLHYHRGTSWYQKFFPKHAESARYRAVGEITPSYFYCGECPQRIARFPITKLVLMLRNPVDRTLSYYGRALRDGDFQGSFDEFVSSRTWRAVEQGQYSCYLRQYLQYFSREQILALISEHALADSAGTKQKLAEFLGIEADRFPPTAGQLAFNESNVPKARALYALAFRAARVLRRLDLDWPVNAVKRLGIKQVLGGGRKSPPMAEHTRQHLKVVFEAEIGELERLLCTSLEIWR